MKQNISFQKQLHIKNTRNQTTHNQKPQQSYLHGSNQAQKSSQLSHMKKQLYELTETNKDKQESIVALEKQLEQLEKEQKTIMGNTLKAELEYESVKLENLEKRHKWEEEKQHEEEQNQMDMNNWLKEVQKYNGLPQSAIDSLCAMQYEGSPLDSEICLSCYKEMKTGEMSKYLPCAHLFHMKCIDDHLKVSKVCPACMEEVIV